MNRDEIISKIKRQKFAKSPLRIPFKAKDESNCILEMVTPQIMESPYEISLLSKWRRENDHAFPAQFKVTDEGTKIWCEKALLASEDRLLFWVYDKSENKIGHVGLFRLSPDAKGIEIDNIMRGEKSSSQGIIQCAIQTLLDWQRDYLSIPNSYLRVFSNNLRAIQLYEKLDYVEIQRVPLEKIVSDARVDWKEIIASPYKKAEKYFVTMFQERP